eukprot:g3977.t1
MTEMPKCSLTQILTNSGETWFLSVEWLTNGLFNIEAINGVSAWKAGSCGYPLGINMCKETWLIRASEAFGFEANPTKEFCFEFCHTRDAASKDLRWYWNENDGLKVGFVRLFRCDLSESTNRLLSIGCNLSSTLTVLSKESQSTQAEIEREMDSVRKEVKEAVRSRRAIYSRCAEIIKEKNQQLKELLEKQGESVVAVENENLYCALTTDQEKAN